MQLSYETVMALWAVGITTTLAGFLWLVAAVRDDYPTADKALGWFALANIAGLLLWAYKTLILG
jgi:hypothetical protein